MQNTYIAILLETGELIREIESVDLALILQVLNPSWTVMTREEWENRL